MDSGGISPEERQRQTAADIARKKVLAAYSAQQQTAFSVHVQPQNNQQPTIIGHTNQAYNQQVQNQTNSQTYKAIEPQQQTKSQQQSWQQYHTAWQNYYQKYYSEYYAKAAQNFVEGEKSKLSNEAKAQSERFAEQSQHIRKQQQDIDKARQDIEQQKLSLSNALNNQNVSEAGAQRVEASLRETIQRKADSSFKLKKKHKKLIPIFAGVFVTLFLLFLQYNRMIFAPIMAYVSPGNNNDEEIAAIDPTVTEAPSPDPKLIIPKLNVNVPVHFGINNDDASINAAMMNGVAHFRTPGAYAFPGEVGNTVITGHSAGDLYSNNQYKFIFSGLERLVVGDLIYVNYNSVRYTYKVTGSRTVEPNDVDSLTYTGGKAILTLITCWPLGTSRYRLLVFAEQINPVIGGQTTPSDPTVDDPMADPVPTEEMPANEKTFFEKFWDWLTGN